MKLGLSVTNDTSVGLGVKIAIASLDFSGENKSTTGNTITVSFYQSGTLDVAPDNKKPASLALRANSDVASLIRPAIWLSDNPARMLSVSDKTTITTTSTIKKLWDTDDSKLSEAQLCEKYGPNSVSCVKGVGYGKGLGVSREPEATQ